MLPKLDGLEVSRSNQLVVKETLETTIDPDIFAFGDCAYLVPPGETQAIPPRAQAAHQEASHLVKQIKARLAGQPLKPFKYRDFGSLVSLGHYSTVGSLMGFVTGRKMLIEGFVAKLMYRSLYKMHETALHGYWKVALDTLSRLLTRRTDHLTNHGGQISFPGGRIEEGDASEQAAALRETHEEIGIAGSSIEVLGRLADYHTRTGFRVTPVVGLVAVPFALRADAREVDEVFEVPLSFLLDPANHQRHSREFQGRRVQYYAIPYRDHYIWGATAAMLVNLARHLAQGARGAR